MSNPYPNDSDTVSVPTDAERSPVLSDSKSAGWYGITDEVRIVTAEMRDVPGKDNEPSGERFLDIAVLVNGVFHTSPFRDHTKMPPNSGSKAAKFLRQLGLDPNSFEPSQLVGMPVKVDVALRSWTDRKSGEKVERNHIRNIAGRDFQNRRVSSNRRASNRATPWAWSPPPRRPTSRRNSTSPVNHSRSWV